MTHVNRLKALTECMVWRDEDCVDFDDLRELELRVRRPGEEDSEGNESNSGEEMEREEDEGMEKEGEEVVWMDLELTTPITQNEESVNDTQENVRGEGQEKELNKGVINEEPLNVQGEPDPSRGKGATGGVRRSERGSRLPDRLKDFVLDW